MRFFALGTLTDVYIVEFEVSTSGHWGTTNHFHAGYTYLGTRSRLWIMDMLCGFSIWRSCPYPTDEEWWQPSLFLFHDCRLWACLAELLSLLPLAMPPPAKRPVVLFKPKHRLDHPRNLLISLSRKIFSGSKYPKINILFDFKTEAVSARAAAILKRCIEAWWPREIRREHIESHNASATYDITYS